MKFLPSRGVGREDPSFPFDVKALSIRKLIPFSVKISPNKWFGYFFVASVLSVLLAFQRARLFVRLCNIESICHVIETALAIRGKMGKRLIA